MPGYLSEGCRDLIPRMLVVDPLMRINVCQLRQHAWFLTNLPQYLAAPADVQRPLGPGEAGPKATKVLKFPCLPDEVCMYIRLCRMYVRIYTYLYTHTHTHIHAHTHIMCVFVICVCNVGFECGSSCGSLPAARGKATRCSGGAQIAAHESDDGGVQPAAGCAQDPGLAAVTHQTGVSEATARISRILAVIYKGLFFIYIIPVTHQTGVSEATRRISASSHFFYFLIIY